MKDEVTAVGLLFILPPSAFILPERSGFRRGFSLAPADLLAWPRPVN